MKTKLEKLIESLSEIMKSKGEHFSADYINDIKSQIEDLSDEDGLELIDNLIVYLKLSLTREKEKNGHSIEHGVLWSKLLTTQQITDMYHSKEFFND